MKFRDLPIGQTFDWIGGEYPTFYLRCYKIGPRRYRDENRQVHQVGTINATVYHVGDDE